MLANNYKWLIIDAIEINLKLNTCNDYDQNSDQLLYFVGRML